MRSGKSGCVAPRHPGVFLLVLALGMECLRLGCTGSDGAFGVGFGSHGFQWSTVHMKPFVLSKIPAWLCFERQCILNHQSFDAEDFFETCPGCERSKYPLCIWCPKFSQWAIPYLAIDVRCGWLMPGVPYVPYSSSNYLRAFRARMKGLDTLLEPLQR